MSIRPAYSLEFFDSSASLRALRLMRGQKQAELAQTMSRGQSDISRIEHSTDLQLSTLRAYVEALGGRLELVASFPEGRVRLDTPPK